jgi:hypothetical protein
MHTHTHTHTITPTHTQTGEKWHTNHTHMLPCSQLRRNLLALKQVGISPQFINQVNQNLRVRDHGHRQGRVRALSGGHKQCVDAWVATLYNMCVYVCVHVHVSACVYAYVYACVCVYTHKQSLTHIMEVCNDRLMHPYIHTHTHLPVCTHTYTPPGRMQPYIYTHTHLPVCTHTRTPPRRMHRIHTHTCTPAKYTHTHTHLSDVCTHIHTHTHLPVHV